MLNPKLFHVGKVKIITFKLSDFFIASSRLSKNLISYFRIKNRHKLAVFYQSQHMCQLMIILKLTSLTHHQFGSQLREFQRSSSLYVSPSSPTSTQMG